MNKKYLKSKAFKRVLFIAVFVLIAAFFVISLRYWYLNVYKIEQSQKQTQTTETKKVLGQTSEQDQYCFNVNPNAHESWQYNDYFREQSFIPTMDRLTMVNLTLGGANLNGNTPLRLAVLTPGKAIIGQKTIYPTFSQMWGVEFVFSEPVMLTPGNTYYLRLELMNENDASWIYWYTGEGYTRGQAFESGTPMPYDFAFITYGYNYQEPVDETKNPVNNTPATSNTTTKTTTTAEAPVVAASQLAVPLNFRVDNDADDQKVLAWDKNKEADLAGYVLYVYEAKKETELQIIDINDKELDNYNLDLAGHPKLKAGSEYDVKLAAKNTAGAVSEKTLSLRLKYPSNKVEVAVQAEKTLLTNPYVLGGLGMLLVVLTGLLIFLEKKFHGLGRLFTKKAKK